MEKSGKLVAKNIRKIRSMRNLTQSDLADLAGLSLRGIQAIETEGRSPRSETIEKIAKALDVQVSELYSSQISAVGGTYLKSDLLTSLYSRAPTLDEHELRMVLGFIDDLTATLSADTKASGGGVKSGLGG